MGPATDQRAHPPSGSRGRREPIAGMEPAVGRRGPLRSSARSVTAFRSPQWSPRSDDGSTQGQPSQSYSKRHRRNGARHQTAGAPGVLITNGISNGYRPQWSPPSDGGSTGRAAGNPGDLVQAAMKPPVRRQERHRDDLPVHLPAVAAMEPTAGRREHSSQNPGRPICANRSSFERSKFTGLRTALDGVVKVQKRPLTCVRALPGSSVTTSVLAERWEHPAPERPQG